MSDWSKYKPLQEVECIFTPRPEFNGRKLHPAVKSHIGEKIKLTPLWLMGEGDPYPGEWALANANRYDMVFGRLWIASGDVTINE